MTRHAPVATPFPVLVSLPEEMVAMVREYAALEDRLQELRGEGRSLPTSSPISDQPLLTQIGTALAVATADRQVEIERLEAETTPPPAPGEQP